MSYFNWKSVVEVISISLIHDWSLQWDGGMNVVSWAWNHVFKFVAVELKSGIKIFKRMPYIDQICVLDGHGYRSDIKDDKWDEGYPACWCDNVFSYHTETKRYHLHKSSGITSIWTCL